MFWANQTPKPHVNPNNCRSRVEGSSHSPIRSKMFVQVLTCNLLKEEIHFFLNTSNHHLAVTKILLSCNQLCLIVQLLICSHPLKIHRHYDFLHLALTCFQEYPAACNKISLTFFLLKEMCKVSCFVYICTAQWHNW